MPVEQPAIEVVPVGDVPTALLSGLLPAIEAHFPRRIARLAYRGLPRPDYAFVPDRNQYLSEIILGELAGLPSRAERVLGVVDLDLFAWPAPFIFGQAETGRPVAIIALRRLRPEFWHRPANSRLLLRRAVKEAVHELGHTYGLPHCPDPTCVMHLSIVLADSDFKGDRFCARDEACLAHTLSRAA